MKAVRLVAPGHPLELCDIPVPELGPQDVLIRVRAAGLCHSDAHYRSGESPAGPLPLTLGHEVAGTVEGVGPEVASVQSGDRVCVHYLVSCGVCARCRDGTEQFCDTGKMIGKHRDGGFAEFLCVPARSVFKLPPEIPFEHGAILMCSAATSLHALHKARLQPEESVAVFGIGGLGISAVQLAKACGAREVFAVDVQPSKLELARQHGAIPVNARSQDPVSSIHRLTTGRGVDVALELIGLPLTMRQAVQVLAVFGRAALVGITRQRFEIAPYVELLNREAEIIGVSDHLASEIPALLDWTRQRKLDLAGVVTRTIPLEAPSINEALDQLQRFGTEVRVVVKP